MYILLGYYKVRCLAGSYLASVVSNFHMPTMFGSLYWIKILLTVVSFLNARIGRAKLFYELSYILTNIVL